MDSRLTLWIDTPWCVLGSYNSYNEDQMQFPVVIAARTRDIKLIISRFQMLTCPAHRSRLIVKAYYTIGYFTRRLGCIIYDNY